MSEEKWKELVAWHCKWDENSRAEKPIHNPGYDANPLILWADAELTRLRDELKTGNHLVAEMTDKCRDLESKLATLKEEKEKAEAQLCRAREALIHKGSASLYVFGERIGAILSQVGTALSSSTPCPHAAVAERAGNVEGMAAAIYKASSDFQADESVRWPNNWKDTRPQYIAAALSRWLLGDKL